MINEFENLVNTIKRLRGKNGCPWDKKQNFKSIIEPLVEESYEIIDAINLKNYSLLKEELGDLLIQIIFLSRLAEEKKRFNILDVIRGAKEKLIRRHPHIFGDIKVKGTKQVLENWERIKKTEKEDKKEKYSLGDVPSVLPSLLKAKKIQNKASRFGFDWGNKEGPVNKLKEEIEEFLQAVETDKKRKVEDEMGDIFFSLVNIARFYHINPEESLNKTIKKFIKRFNFIERALEKKGKSITDSNLEEMDFYWEKAKKHI
ncbi:MAG: nucleoside triphosphate pyrophosphohydrolase [Spirochaetes bacterium]|nr:nucleoside triphosphate pyrophosphohydrolase [Spirochaetota bacterium]